MEFFSIEPTREVITTITCKNGTTIEKPEERPAHLPFFGAFARSIGVNEDTIVEWAKAHPEFSVAYAQAKDLQKSILITCGLLGLYNPVFAKFTAVNITNWRDKQDIEHSGNLTLNDAGIALGIARGTAKQG